VARPSASIAFTEEPLFGREEWCLPNKSLLKNNGIEHNVECFRHVMSQAGPDDYEEIPGCLEPRPKILRNGSAEANQKESNRTGDNFWSNLWNALLNSLVDTRNEWNMYRYDVALPPYT
jgi:hypothetical protein